MKTTMLSLLLLAALLCRPAFCGEIQDAAGNGDLEKVKALLKDNPNLVFSKDENGMTALHYAARFGYKDVVELLLANKADANAQTKQGLTPLEMASMGGHKDVAELLLAHGAWVNFTGGVGKTPLAYAAFFGEKDVAELLIANKADVDAQDNTGDTPLHSSAWAGYKEVAELLLANGAKVNAKNSYGDTPLHLAATVGHMEVAELLLANKANVNATDGNGHTPLHVAAAAGHKDMVELLRHHGGLEEADATSTSTQPRPDADKNSKEVSFAIADFTNRITGTAATKSIIVLVSSSTNSRPAKAREPRTVGEEMVTRAEELVANNIGYAVRNADGNDLIAEGEIEFINMKPTIWNVGAIHVIAGTLKIGAYTFASDDTDPLEFQVSLSEGYVFVKGMGTVTTPDGTKVTLPRTDNNTSHPRDAAVAAEGDSNYDLSGKEDKQGSIIASPTNSAAVPSKP
jgi:ankyrin repeat protein